MGDPVKKYKAKQFRVAVAGKTIDGREITEQQISDMAATYSTTKYQARIWLEHIRGYAPDSMFGAYGDVLQVEAKRDANNILGLYATLEPLPAMVKITTELKQKIFSSIEINPNFQGTGRAYLEGLAFTDSPASTGCDVLQFSLKADAAKRPDRLFSIPAEIDGVQFEEATASTVESLLAGLTTAVSNFTALFSSQQQQPATPPATPATPQPVTATAVADLFSKLADVVKDQAAKFTKQQNEMAKLRTELDELKTQFSKIDHQPSGQQRPPATGGAPSGNAYSGM